MFRGFAAAALLGVFVLGAALHGLHHLQDPGCSDGEGRDGRACAVCASVHASTLVARDVVAPVPVVHAWTPLVAVVAVAPLVRARVAAPPRAPPRG